MTLIPWRLAVAAVAAASLLGLSTGCGSSSSDSGTRPAGASAPLFKELPAKHQQAGRIAVGSDIAYAPMEYYDTDGTTILGFDKELADAIGRQLGVPLESATPRSTD